jgi:hypothetical protein
MVDDPQPDRFVVTPAMIFLGLEGAGPGFAITL